jgi:lipopolysaccharide biosynthesis regulator YciM
MAAATGWYLARVRLPSQASRQSAASSAYVKGVNFLLNEQPDKAIDVFLQVLEVESETIETHLALGNLFRRRGEVERAIRIHQNVIAHPAINDQQRALALLELGMDYMRSGLYDRAEGLFTELLRANFHVRRVLEQLLEIYQQEQDWGQAIACAGEIESRCRENLRTLKAQYLCERVEGCIARGDHAQAHGLIREALAMDPDCARASLIEGRLAMSAGDLRGAIVAFKRVERQDRDLFGEALAPLRECHKRLGALRELTDYLCTRDLGRAGIAPMMMAADLLAESEGADRAIAYLGEALRLRPSLRGLDRLIDLSLRSRQCLPQAEVEVFKALTTRLLRGRSNYRCGHCGFAARRLHWQCPGCRRWGTVRPILDVESG